MSGEQIHWFLIVLALAAIVGAFLVVALCFAAARTPARKP